MTSSLIVSYPYEDDLGFIWVDQNAFLSEKFGNCFICKKPTKRLDIHYEGHFCGSDGCEDTIRRDLARINMVSTDTSEGQQQVEDVLPNS